MRKYQQLVLLVCSCISIIILLVYKSENSRLKDVLNVVNFFGRNITTVQQSQNLQANGSELYERYKFTLPLPAWSWLGGAFYAYSAYWQTKPLRSISDPAAGGGEVIAVVAAESVLVNFKCYLDYENRRVEGKFRFQRMEVEQRKTGFLCFNFFCESTEAGHPHKVVFSDLNTKHKQNYTVKLRGLASASASFAAAAKPLISTLCVDLVSVTASAATEAHLLQFFLHHHLVGVQDFVIYNGDEMPVQLLARLQHLRIGVHLLPFNFPFGTVNAAGLGAILQTDCLLRTHGQATQFVALVSPNEFLFLQQQQAVLSFASSVVKLKLSTRDICTDPAKKLLMDNYHYDAAAQDATDIILHRPYMPAVHALSPDSTIAARDSALALRYVSCSHVGQDGLNDWRSSLRVDFIAYIRQLRDRMQHLL